MAEQKNLEYVRLNPELVKELKEKQQILKHKIEEAQAQVKVGDEDSYRRVSLLVAKLEVTEERLYAATHNSNFAPVEAQTNSQIKL